MPPVFDFDEDHSYFLIRLPVQRKEKSIPRQEDVGQVTGQVTALLSVMNGGEKSRKELMNALQLRGRDNFEKLYLLAALSENLIERNIPNIPNSRLQKYRIEEKGKALIGRR